MLVHGAHTGADDGGDVRVALPLGDPIEDFGLAGSEIERELGARTEFGAILVDDEHGQVPPVPVGKPAQGEATRAAF